MGIELSPGGSGGGPPYIPVPEAFTRYVASNGNDLTGNGSAALPFATVQKAYADLFPLGFPASWADFDNFRKIVILPDTIAGNLAAVFCKLVVEGDSCSVGIVTFDVESNFPTTQGWIGPVPSDPYPRLHCNGRGFGHDSSANLSTFNISEMRLANDSTVGSTNLLFVGHRVKFDTFCSQRLDATVPGSFAAPIYADFYNCAITFLIDAAGIGPQRAGARSYNFRAFESIFRAQVSSVNGSLGAYEIADCYFRGGWNGVLLADASTSFERGWKNSHFRAAVVFTNPGLTNRKIDRTTWKSLLSTAGFTPGNVVFQLSDDPAGTVRPAAATVGSPGSAWYKSDVSHRDGTGFSFRKNASGEWAARDAWVISKLHDGNQDLPIYNGNCPARCVVLSVHIYIPAIAPPAGFGQLFSALLAAGNRLSAQGAGWFPNADFGLLGFPYLVPEGGSAYWNTANPAMWTGATIDVVFGPLP
jgi:hypothetical protein